MGVRPRVDLVSMFVKNTHPLLPWPAVVHALGACMAQLMCSDVLESFFHLTVEVDEQSGRERYQESSVIGLPCEAIPTRCLVYGLV